VLEDGSELLSPEAWAREVLGAPRLSDSSRQIGKPGIRACITLGICQYSRQELVVTDAGGGSRQCIVSAPLEAGTIIGFKKDDRTAFEIASEIEPRVMSKPQDSASLERDGIAPWAAAD
jgi:hypothetical protein